MVLLYQLLTFSPYPKSNSHIRPILDIEVSLNRTYQEQNFVTGGSPLCPMGDPISGPKNQLYIKF